MIKTITYCGAKFTINSDGELIRLEGGRGDIFIPSVFPTGERITAIGSEFCAPYDSHSSIVVDNAISVIKPRAFMNIKAGRVVWPSSCRRIPEGCFVECNMKAILNIENVEEVGDFAFKHSTIKSIEWPSKCTKIPLSCFHCSSLRTITNIQNVKEIEPCAFSCSYITEFAWPSGCEEIPAFCFEGSALTHITGIENVKTIRYKAFKNCSLGSIIWPSECHTIPCGCFSLSRIKEIFNIQNVSHIERCAFKDALLLENLDLSHSAVVDIDEGAFYGLDSSIVKFPYYISRESIKEAFEIKEVS